MIVSVAVFSAYDGTAIAYRTHGHGSPLVCLPGGPMQDSAYLEDLGGLSKHRQLIMVDLRGTGLSDKPSDPTSYRCDRLVDDVEAMRTNLGLDQLDLLGHCAGANLAVSYAVRHPERVRRLLLITPSTFAVGITATSEMRREVVMLRADEPWFPQASAAFEKIASGNGTEEDWTAITPFTYGRWDSTARTHEEAGRDRRNDEAAAIYGSDGAYDPVATRKALAAFRAPVLLLAGERDVAAPPRALREIAELFPNATFIIQPGAGHFPWLDDPAWFSSAIVKGLSEKALS